MTQLSVMIICKNEATHIQKCLESVKFADEIIVLDSGSTDETLSICRQYPTKIFESEWPGSFGVQKNRALSYTTREWILSIDADEHLSPELAQEIQQLVAHEQAYDGFYLPRLSSYCGRVIHYGSWRGDTVLRLFRRKNAAFSNDAVHEKVLLSGKIGLCRGKLLHDSFGDLNEVLNKMNHYSTLAANSRAARGERGSLPKAIGHGLWTFIRGYIFKLGFLDGAEGFMLAVSNAEGSYYRYVKLRCLARDDAH